MSRPGHHTHTRARTHMHEGMTRGCVASATRFSCTQSRRLRAVVVDTSTEASRALNPSPHRGGIHLRTWGSNQRVWLVIERPRKLARRTSNVRVCAVLKHPVATLLLLEQQLGGAPMTFRNSLSLLARAIQSGCFGRIGESLRAFSRLMLDLRNPSCDVVSASDTAIGTHKLHGVLRASSFWA